MQDEHFQLSPAYPEASLSSDLLLIVQDHSQFAVTFFTIRQTARSVGIEASATSNHGAFFVYVVKKVMLMVRRTVDNSRVDTRITF